eukprot:289791-Prymnesium_polylepis.1
MPHNENMDDAPHMETFWTGVKRERTYREEFSPNFPKNSEEAHKAFVPQCEKQADSREHNIQWCGKMGKKLKFDPVKRVKFHHVTQTITMYGKFPTGRYKTIPDGPRYGDDTPSHLNGTSMPLSNKPFAYNGVASDADMESCHITSCSQLRAVLTFELYGTEPPEEVFMEEIFSLLKDKPRMYEETRQAYGLTYPDDEMKDMYKPLPIALNNGGGFKQWEDEYGLTPVNGRPPTLKALHDGMPKLREWAFRSDQYGEWVETARPIVLQKKREENMRLPPEERASEREVADSVERSLWALLNQDIERRCLDPVADAYEGRFNT